MEEAVESLVHQTIGFDKIQLILVDDGSIDGSGAICDRYAEKYPNHVQAIHKENGGIATARNLGLQHVKGKYISFFDPDDILDRKAMEKVRDFMDRHPEVDVCCIPIVMFGAQNGSHILNYKFEQGTRVIDLSQEEEAHNIQLSSASAFYRASVAKEMSFDARFVTAEDAKENLRLLLNNPLLGVVSDTAYHYRKHGNSTVDHSKTKAGYYLPWLNCYANWVLDTAENRFGFIPSFVQYTIMYDLQWRLNDSRIRSGVLSPEEKEQFLQLLFRTISRIDDDVILKQRNTGVEQKLFALRKKHGCLPEQKIIKSNDILDGYDIGDLALTFGNTQAVRVSEETSFWEFVSFDKERNSVTLEGSHNLFSVLEMMEFEPCVVVNKRVIPCERVVRTHQKTLCLGTEIARRLGYRVTIPLMDSMEIYPALRRDKLLIPRKTVRFGQFFPINDVYANIRSYADGRMLYAEEGILKIAAPPSWIGRTKRECALLSEIWKKNLLGGRKAVFGRLYYHAVKPFKRRQLWIVSDRIMKADDNGEALFCYLMEHKPKNTRILFAISKKSPDSERIKKIGPCVDAMSFRHKLLHLLCDVNISAQADGVTVNPFCGHSEALQDLVVHPKFVFLQHGVTQNDISGWLNWYNKNINGFVTTAFPEHQSVLGKSYAYPSENIWLVGFPRFDRLYHREEKAITLMPTWRQYLMKVLDSKTGVWTMEEAFQNSRYYRFYSGLLSSRRLLDAVEQNGYTLRFFPHPNVRLGGVQFQHDPRVQILPSETAYRDIYATSSLMLTDYSSAIFDFAYLRKPIIYCQFDKKEFFAGEHVCNSGYFDYERDGFGEVEYDLESTIDRIIEYMENGCQLKPEYRKRIDKFFAFNDRNNCKRVAEKILELSEKQQ